MATAGSQTHLCGRQRHCLLGVYACAQHPCVVDTADQGRLTCRSWCASPPTYRCGTRLIGRRDVSSVHVIRKLLLTLLSDVTDSLTRLQVHAMHLCRRALAHRDSAAKLTLVAMCSAAQMGITMGATTLGLWFGFAGFLIQRPFIPPWWKWCAPASGVVRPQVRVQVVPAGKSAAAACCSGASVTSRALPACNRAMDSPWAAA